MLLDDALQQKAMGRAHDGTILVADVGGTRCRFGIATAGGRPAHVLVIDNRQVPDFESAVARYLESTGARPRAATIAVAGPVTHAEDVTLTNHHWRFRRGDIAKRFGFSHLRVINDFEAIAWALAQLGEADGRQHVRRFDGS